MERPKLSRRTSSTRTCSPDPQDSSGDDEGDPRDCCTICQHALHDPRVLDCGHDFCLDCLRGILDGRTVECPTCKEDTEIPEGLEVRHLRKRPTPLGDGQEEVPGAREPGVEACWFVPGEVLGVTVGDDGKIYLGVATSDGPLRLYDIGGGLVRTRDTTPEGEPLVRPRLAMDLSRGVLAVLSTPRKSAPVIVTFDRELSPLTSLRPSDLASPTSITFHPGMDLYILPDRGRRAILLLHPSGDPCRLVEVVEKGEMTKGVSVGCDGSGRYKHWVTADWAAEGGGTVGTGRGTQGVVRVWGPGEQRLGTYGPGMFHFPYGVAVDREGGVVVCDTYNHRLLCLPLSSLSAPDLSYVTSFHDMPPESEGDRNNNPVEKKAPIGDKKPGGGRKAWARANNKTRLLTRGKASAKSGAGRNEAGGTPGEQEEGRPGKIGETSPGRTLPTLGVIPSLPGSRPTSLPGGWAEILNTRQFHLGGPRLLCIGPDQKVLLVLRHRDGPSYILLLDNVIPKDRSA